MTQTAKDYLKSEMNRKVAEAQAITANAESETRSVTSEEKDQVERLIAEAQGLKSKITSIEDNEHLRKSIEDMNGVFNQPPEEAPTSARTFGEAFVKADAYRALKSGGMKGGKWTTGPIEVDAGLFGGKATVSEAASAIIQPSVTPGILPTLFRRLTVADLIASGTTDSNTVRYLQETTATNAAAAVAEEGIKPESTLIFTQVDEPVRKVATFLPVSDEMLEDEGQIRSYLDGRLRLFIEHAEEAQLLSGSGTAPNIRGILNRTGVQTVAKLTGVPIHDYVFDAITNIRVNALIEPDGIVMHPTNWAVVRKGKDANNQYYGGGPFMGPYGVDGIAADSLWGLPVVVTSAMTLNTALVGAFRTQAQVFRRGGITVEASNSHSDFFQKNLTAIRAEERLALAVYRPAAFHTITSLNVV